MLLGRCPRCGWGSIFAPSVTGLLGIMNQACEVCGLRFLREAGYFLGAMYISYGLGVATVLPVAVVLALVFELHLALVLTVMFVQTLLSMPLFLRLSRSVWLHFDQFFDPA